MSRGHWFLLGVPALFLGILMTLRHTGRMKLSGHLAVLIMFATILGGELAIGGTNLLIISMSTVLAVLAFLFIGAIEGVFWTAALAATHLWIIAADAPLVQPVGVLTGPQQELTAAIIIVTTYLLIAAASASYDFATRILIGKIRAERHDFQQGAHLDALTQLGNRRQYDNSITLLTEHAKASHGSFVLAYIDLDRFKPINDRYGHAVGDKVLVECAARITGSVRGEDIVCRIGGDEFAILFQHISSRDSAATAVGHVVTSIRDPIIADGHRLEVGASVGVALFPTDAATRDELTRLADQRMYQAKSQRSGICLEG
jgi:diguanylate cyclase (GGDEF)-like protein